MTKELKLFIAGEWKESSQRQEIRSPFDGSLLATIPIASERQFEDAVAASGKAFMLTKELPRAERSRILSNIAAGIRERAKDFAVTIAEEAGKPISQSEREVERAVNTFSIAAEEAKRLGGEVVPLDIEKSSKGYSASVLRFPIGPVAAISPFNFPLNLVAHKVAPAIAAGNTVIHKPAHNTPMTAFKLAEVIESSGAVPGTYNMIQLKRPLSESLATDDRIKLLTFTGSAEVGWHLKRLAYRKKVTLELGGNAGVVIDRDCDLAWGAKRCAEGSFAYAGQICISIQRIFVERGIFGNFTELLLNETAKLKTGDPMKTDTFVGPLIDTESADRVIEWISEAKKKGAKMLAGGERVGNIITPAILTGVDRSCKIYAEEAFGPVVLVEPCDNFEDGLARVNDSKFGLQASVFTYDIRKIEKAFREIEAGGIIINDYPTYRQDNYPYGGMKESGIGREGVKYAIEEMTELKTLVINFNK